MSSNGAVLCDCFTEHCFEWFKKELLKTIRHKCIYIKKCFMFFLFFCLGVKMERFDRTMHCKRFTATVRWSFHERHERWIVVAGSRWSDTFCITRYKKNMHLLHICAIKSANTLIWVWSNARHCPVLCLLWLCWNAAFATASSQKYGFLAGTYL